MARSFCFTLSMQIQIYLYVTGAVFVVTGQDAPSTNSTIEVCNATSCQNSGVCNAQYICECQHGFYGSKCQYVACNGDVFVEEEARLVSPNFPSKYPFYDQCIFNIYTQPGKLLQLKFIHFEVENSTGCDKDRLLIHDGKNETSPLFGKYCGMSLPQNIITSNNRIRVMFLTDGTIEETGFEAVITAVPDNGSYDATRKLYSVCEDTATKAFGGTIVSHFGYQIDGPPNNNCTIQIAPMNKYDRVYMSVKSVKLSNNIVKETSCVIEKGVLRLGSGINDGHSHKVASPEMCCFSCEGTSNCRAWSFDNSDGGTIGNCWLLDDQPYPETHLDFISGILDPCTKQEQRILVYDGGKLSGGACAKTRHGPFIVSGTMDINAILGSTDEKGNGFEAIFTQFYVVEEGQSCIDDNDFRCDNNRCIPGYLVTDCDDHCGDGSDVLPKKCQKAVFFTTGKQDVGLILGLTLGLGLPIMTLLVVGLITCYRNYTCSTGDPSENDDNKGNGMSTFNVFIAKS